MQAGAVFLFATSLIYAADQPLYVGVLEHSVAQADDRQTSARPNIRVAFQFVNGSWSAMPHEAEDLESLAALQKLFPVHLSWSVALDGKKLGAVESHSLDYRFYRDVGLHELTPESKFPTMRDPAKTFVTWMGASRYRPLVVISQPNYGDPDRWKPFRPTPALGKQAHAALRSALGEPAPRYSDSAIYLQPKGYRSSRGDALIELRLNKLAHAPDGPAEAWFLIKDAAVYWIGSGLTLVDAGDYDGDGSSEILFQKSLYNRDGYLLFHVRDRSKQEFDWSYH